MISLWHNLASAQTPDSLEIAQAESTPPSLPGPLQQVDDIVSIVATVGAILLCAAWLKNRKDPLENSPQRPNTFTAETVGFAVVGYAISGIILTLALGEWNAENHVSIRSQFVGIATQLAAILICFVLIARQFEGGIVRFIIGTKPNVNKMASITGLSLLLAIGCCPVILQGTVWLVRLFAPDQDFPTHATLDVLQKENQPFAVVVCLWLAAAVVAPVAEETFFRGILQPVVSSLSKNRWLGLFFGAMAFGFAHSQQPHAIPALIFLGILCGIAYERTGSMLVPIAIHSLFNFKTLIWQALSTWMTTIQPAP
ncbi:MAG: CPBP family intramembrane glutamic endopeptidase [Planctomycetota bacterium]